MVLTQDVILTSIQRFLNVMDVKWTLKQCCVLTRNGLKNKNKIILRLIKSFRKQDFLTLIVPCIILAHNEKSTRLLP